MKPSSNTSSSEAGGAPPADRAAVRPRIVLTSGEPAGIGPDLCLALARTPLDCELICLADPALLAERARRMGYEDVRIRLYDAAAPAAHAPGTLTVLPVALAAECTAGRPDPRNAPSVLAMIDRAIEGCRTGEFAALVTAPVQKSAIMDAGIAFSGHTEYLAARTGAPRPVMMLAAGALRVALATTHLPLAAVSGAITRELLGEVLDILDRDLKRWWGLPEPRIAVCGLNPHAGEGGHLGHEEIDTIGPAIELARARGVRAAGPFPADTVFVARRLAAFDAVLAMYHDQGLPVIKHA